MRKIYRMLALFLLLAALPQSLKAASKETLLRCLAESEQFTQEEKDALAANMRKYSMFGFYAVTANDTRASGIAVVTDAGKADMVFRMLEMKTLSSFATVFRIWEEEYDALDGAMSEQGRFSAIRQLNVFYGRIAPQTVITKERKTLEDGCELMVLRIPADKVIIEREKYKEEVRRKFGEALLALYVQCRQNGDVGKCALLKKDLRHVGLDAPDEALLDYLQALRDNDDAAAAVLLEDVAPMFRQLPPMMRKVVLEVVSASRRKEDVFRLEENKDNMTKELK